MIGVPLYQAQQAGKLSSVQGHQHAENLGDEKCFAKLLSFQCKKLPPTARPPLLAPLGRVSLLSS